LGCSNRIVGHQIQNHPSELRGVEPA
jgi:hypothetical protein